jgi:N-acetylmuramoyl-L-alanine amidase
MKIIEKLLSKNPYSRPMRLPVEVKAIILHWTGVPMQRALATWNFFEKTCPQQKHYSSAHYIIDLNGDIIHAVPDGEVAYHCGSSQKDPVSGRIFTDWARAKLGKYVGDPERNSPNNCTIGIELCVIDEQGTFTPETLQAAAGLVAKLLKEHDLPVDDIGTHNKVVGWKDCPRWWTNHPADFELFKSMVKTFL